ncbi:MAG: UDP-N-acetylglucosamine 2-epimerase [Acidimicrobiales bacterium]
MTSSEAMGGPHRIGVFTAARSDGVPLGPVLAALEAAPDVECVVIATGGHLEESRGRTVDHLAVSRRCVEIVDVVAETSAAGALTEAAARMTQGIGEVLERRRIETLVVLGDRWELLAASTAALLGNVALVHLHGGEITAGSIDDRIRHAVAKLADLHCCANDDSARRLRQLGEDAARVVVTGAPGLDRHRGRGPVADEDLEATLGHRVARPFGLVTYHPETIERHSVGERAEQVVEAAARRLGTALVLYPGVDQGADEVVDAIEAVAARHGHVHTRPHVGDDYALLLAAADVMIGNSSSGIWESATFALPVVDVGNRQRGRLAPANVLWADYCDGAIERAIDRALAPSFRSSLLGMSNPYGDGDAARRIVEAVRSLPRIRPLPKVFRDLEEAL